MLIPKEILDKQNWKRASKTKEIWAKPMSSLVIDKDFTTKLLLETLEGTQSLKDNSIVCLGASKDVWQQEEKKLFAKYNVVGIEEGWWICKPKPDNEVDCIQINEILISDGSKKFEIVGLWGKESKFGPLQFGVLGDYVCRNIEDLSDIWIVKNFLFRSTYTILGEDMNDMGKSVFPFRKVG